MARNMLEKSTGVYRTVVTTTWTADSVEKEFRYSYSSPEKRTNVPVHTAGDVVTEVFGPYANKPQNQNYSTIQIGYFGAAVPRVREDWMTEAQWEGYFKNSTTSPYVRVAEPYVRRQELKPVLALTPNGALELALDWVDYR